MVSQGNRQSGHSAQEPSQRWQVSVRNHSEWIWVLAVSGLAMLLANLPYLLGYLSAPAGFVYAGVAVAPGDILSYLSAIRQGMNGSWLYHIPYTFYEHGGVPAYTYYLALGHLARMMRLAPQAMLHLARIGGSLFFLVTLYRFLGKYFRTRCWRRYAFLLAVFSSGLGWLLLALGGYLSMDLTVPEANTFFMLMGNAHFPVALACLLLFWSSLIDRGEPSGARRNGGRLQAFVAAGVLANLQPFIFALALIVASLALGARWARSGALPRESVVRVVAAVAAGVPMAGWITLGMMRDPLGYQWLLQNKNLTPHPGYVLSAYGLLWIPAVLGATSILGKKSFRTILLLTWLLTTLAGLYAPVDFQRRLSLGLHTAIAISAVLGLQRMLGRYKPHLQERARQLFFVAVIPTNAALVLLYSAGILARNPQLYMTRGEYEALAWLDAHFQQVDVVLSSTELAVFIPAFTDHRAVSGNAFSTPNAKETEAEVRSFFSAEIGEAERERMLQKWRVKYILVGERERSSGIGSLSLGLNNCISKVRSFREVDLYGVDCLPRVDE